MLSPDLCDDSDEIIFVKRTIAAAANENHKVEKDVEFKNNAPFRSRISKNNRLLIGNAEDRNMVMPMYNLLEYSQSYSMTSENLWRRNWWCRW